MNGKVLSINFNADYLTSNNISVEYKAKLNNNAVIGPTGNKTTTTLTYATEPYGTGTTTTDEIINTVYTYSIKLFKHDGSNNGLQNANYTVYSDSSLETEVGTITTGSDGYGTVKGLKDGTYYLKEKKAPTGYKINNDIITVQINNTKDYTEVTTSDSKMGLLPSTGGTGTYIFVIVGALIIILAFIFLYKNNKKDKNDNDRK